MADKVDTIEDQDRPAPVGIRRPFPTKDRGPCGKAEDHRPCGTEQPIGRLPARFFEIAVPQTDGGQGTPRPAQHDGPGYCGDDMGFRHAHAYGPKRPGLQPAIMAFVNSAEACTAFL